VDAKIEKLMKKYQKKDKKEKLMGKIECEEEGYRLYRNADEDSPYEVIKCFGESEVRCYKCNFRKCKLHYIEYSGSYDKRDYCLSCVIDEVLRGPPDKVCDRISRKDYGEAMIEVLKRHKAGDMGDEEGGEELNNAVSKFLFPNLIKNINAWRREV